MGLDKKITRSLKICLTFAVVISWIWKHLVSRRTSQEIERTVDREDNLFREVKSKDDGETAPHGQEAKKSCWVLNLRNALIVACIIILALGTRLYSDFQASPEVKDDTVRYYVEKICESAKKQYIYWTLLFAILFFVCLIMLPLIVNRNTGLSKAERIVTDNEIRDLFLKAVGGGVLFIGVYFTFQQLLIARDQYYIARRNTELAKFSRDEERFVAAMTLLGSNRRSEMFKVIGGIYALESVSKGSPEDFTKVMETLALYIRTHSQDRILYDPAESMDPDIKMIILRLAAMTGNSPGTKRSRSTEPFVYTLASRNLRGVNLDKADLQGMTLDSISFQNAHLRSVHLEKSHLPGTDFSLALMQWAKLSGANMVKTNFIGSHLEHADLRNCDRVIYTQIGGIGPRRPRHVGGIREVNFSGAHLQGADFRGSWLSGVDFKGADLKDVHLEGVDLSTAKGLTTNQINQTYMDSNSQVPPGIKRSERRFDRD